VGLRVPFELERQAIDDVDRGANDSDWQPLKEVAKRIAFAEDRAIFEGYAAAGIQGIRPGTSNPLRILPSDVVHYPDAIAEALSPSAALTRREEARPNRMDLRALSALNRGKGTTREAMVARRRTSTVSGLKAPAFPRHARDR